ncbi:MAG: SpoIIE family protein phosphatase [Candidatus Rifleibacteriota bacterium]
MKNEKKNVGIFSFFIFCFILIPGLLLFGGIYYFRQQTRASLLKQHRQELNRFFSSLQSFSDGEAFWCRFFANAINRNLKGKSVKETVLNINSKVAQMKNNLQFDHIIFHPSVGIASASVEAKPRSQWLAALKVIQKRLRRHNHTKRDFSKDEQKVVGLVFGPQLNFEHLDQGWQENFIMTWPDITHEKPLLWTRCVEDVLVVFMVDYEDLDAEEGIKNFLNEFSARNENKYKFAILKPDKKIEVLQGQNYLLPQLEKAVDRHQQEKSFQIETDDLYVFPLFLRPDLTIIGYFDKEMNKASFAFYHILSILVFVLLSYFLAKYALEVFVYNKPDSLSLRWKLRFLFFFANGLPLLVIFFLGTDYLDQKKNTLLQEALAEGTAFLQNFDESFESEFARVLIQKKIAEDKLMSRLRKQPINEKALDEFVSYFKEYDNRIYLIASRSKVIGTKYGLFDPDNNIIPKEFRRKTEKNKREIRFTRKLGQFFVDFINGAKISSKIATEFEILVESVTQKPVVNFVFELMQNRNSFTEWGFGKNVHPAIIDTFTLGTTNNEDFFFISLFDNEDFQHRFLKKMIPRVNRNKLGIKVIAFSDKDYTVPPKAYSSEALRVFSSALTSFPGDEIKIIEYHNQKFLAMGFSGNSIDMYNLIGLYPIHLIEGLIARQKHQLLIFAILSLLLALTLSQILAQSFLVPLNQLSDGAKAIENKNFRHRLPDMSHDEFGKMGEIFNDVMVDLDELSVASAIQEQLLPQKDIDPGRFSLFGRSISMGELGGDYYDFIELEDGNFSVLLGDVAGHGVGAALIMAMAKAGIIQSEDLLDQPLNLITRLHNLIYSSKTRKQKKIMTFQYLYVNGQTGKGLYTNAGACSPMIIRKNENKVEELQLTGAALGAFKRAKFSEVELCFQPGDAIIFYTDGIVEARSEDDEEIGYDGLKELLLKNWDSNAEKFYNNVYADYEKHIGSLGSQDDLTMVFMVFQDKNKGRDEAQQPLDKARPATENEKQ